MIFNIFKIKYHRNKRTEKQFSSLFEQLQHKAINISTSNEFVQYHLIINHFQTNEYSQFHLRSGNPLTH